MRILYIGDIMGEAGMRTVEVLLPQLRQKHQIDAVIAQAENVTEGRGLSLKDFDRLRAMGIDFCTGGNWTLYRNELAHALGDPQSPVLRPANYPSDIPGLRWKEFMTTQGPVLVVSLLGHIVGKDADKPVDNPLRVIEQILEETKHRDYAARVINFHGDFSSEKRIIGYFLDGRASLVVGDHWHVPTADAMVLPNGTAHITDVGMCGALHSSLGVKLSATIPRWRDGIQTRNQLETDGPMQFNAVLVTVNQAGLADTIEQIQQII